MRALLTVSYDGTDYCGWQRQDGQITVQQTIEEALERLYGQKVAILGASRTDSGVHALGQRATFTPPHPGIPVKNLHFAINTHLPNNIRILRAEAKPDTFHVISDAKGKTYAYKIQNGTVYDPVLFRYTHFVPEKLDLDSIHEAANHFIGEHDFKAFCAVHGSATTSMRTIYSLDISKENDVITYEICGNGFLYNMVRIIAGTLAEVGMGKREPSEIPAIIESRSRNNAGITLPSKGLTLINIEY